MKPIATGVLTAIIVAVGRFSQDKSFDFTDGMAAGFMALILIIISKVNRELAGGVSNLIMVGTLFWYGGDIAKTINNALG